MCSAQRKPALASPSVCVCVESTRVGVVKLVRTAYAPHTQRNALPPPLALKNSVFRVETGSVQQEHTKV